MTPSATKNVLRCQLMLAMTLAACSAGTSSDGDGAPKTAEDGGPSRGNPDAPPLPGASDSGSGEGGSGTGDASAACEPETAAIQRAIDAAHPANTDAVAAVKTPACGLRYFTSGPAKVDAAKIHRVASVTKSYVAGAVLKLVSEGLLTLDSPASQWLPTIPGGNTVLVRHLLQHTSGLKPFDGTLGFQACLNFGCTPQQLLKLSFDQGQAGAPGTTFQYANVNFVALGVISEKVAGKPLATLLRERVLTPIGATSTFFAGGETIGATFAVGRDDAGRDATHRLNPTAMYAAGNVAAAPGDVLTWIEALGTGTFHSPQMQAELEKVMPIPGTSDYKYGLGMMEIQPSASFGGGIGRGHNGDLIPGYHTQAFYFPEKKATVVTIIDYTPPGVFQNPQPIYSVFRAVLKSLFSPGSAEKAPFDSADRSESANLW